MRKKDKAESSNECKRTQVRNRKQAQKNKKGQVMKMKKFVLSTIVAVTIVGLMTLLTGCDPEKIGGGGLMQPYNPLNGQYK